MRCFCSLSTGGPRLPPRNSLRSEAYHLPYCFATFGVCAEGVSNQSPFTGVRIKLLSARN